MTAAADLADLSPRERVIVWLAANRAPQSIAAELGTSEDVVRQVAAMYGWPRRMTELRAVSRRLQVGEDVGGEHAGDLPPLDHTPAATSEEDAAMPAPALATPGPTQPAAKACPRADYHLDLDQDQPIRAGDHLASGGLYGTAIHCPDCRRGELVFDPDLIQPGPAPAGWSVDEVLKEDTAAVLQVLDRIGDPLTGEQAGRLAIVERLLGAVGQAEVGQVLTLAAWVETGATS